MPKTLRPLPSLSTSGMRQRPVGRSRVNGEEQCQGQQRVQHNNVAVTDLTNVPSSSSSSAAAASQHPPSDSSNVDVPDSLASVEPNCVMIPLPPPPPSSPPPPPAPPLLPVHGKLLPATTPGTSVAGTNTGTPDPESNVPLCPPGPAPVLKSASESVSLTSLKSTGVSYKPATSAGIDLSAIEAARLRLKKPTRTDTSITCKFCFKLDVTFLCACS